LAKNSRAYKGAKRAKELDRQKKREEKLRRRLAAGKSPGEGGESPSDETAPESGTPESQ
jgi:hypothetical protein